MAKGNARLSGTQVQVLCREVEYYAADNHLSVGDVVVSVNLQSGRLVLTDYAWDDREMRGDSHAEDMPQQKTVEGFSASIRF